MAEPVRVTVIINGAEIGGWTGGHVEISMITASDSFELRRPFDAQHWNLLRRDSAVTIRFNGTNVLSGFIDRRQSHMKAGTMTISGRDRRGRLCDESAPRISYNGQRTLAVIKELASPWFSDVQLDAAPDRRLRRAKGRRVAAANEPTVDIRIRVPRRGLVHPGMTRWQVIHEICSRENIIAYSTADGRKLIVGKPNFNQAPQYVFARARAGSATKTTVRDMTITEDDGERFSLIMVAGIGGQSDTNYGQNVTDRRGVVFDNFANRLDGTGRDFIHPKRLFMPEREFESYGDAQRVAENEQARRDFKRQQVSVECSGFGQSVGNGALTLFTHHTIARVIDEDQNPPLDDLYMVISCAYSFDREQGDSTTLHLVPTGTQIIM